MASFLWRPTNGLIIQLDRGGLYVGGDFQKQFSAFGVRGSMNLAR